MFRYYFWPCVFRIIVVRIAFIQTAVIDKIEQN